MQWEVLIELIIKFCTRMPLMLQLLSIIRTNSYIIHHELSHAPRADRSSTHKYFTLEIVTALCANFRRFFLLGKWRTEISQDQNNNLTASRSDASGTQSDAERPTKMFRVDTKLPVLPEARLVKPRSTHKAFIYKKQGPCRYCEGGVLQ